MQEFFILQGVFQSYEKAFGQSINLHKSGMFFSPNTSPDLMNYAHSYLDISLVNNLGKYLGLPTRNKGSDFSFLKGKVWKTVQSWKAPFFSHGGREVLIKSIARAIPTYAMSCFRLPKNFHKELSQYCAKFSWGFVK